MKKKRTSGKPASPFSGLPKRAEEALRENEANLTALVENTKDRIWAVDADYRLIVRNSQFLQGVKKELKREIALGESVLMDSLPQAVQDEWRSYYDRALRGESFGVEKEMQFYKEPAFIDYRFHPIRSAEGKITGVVVSGRDITERKRTKETLIKSEARFRSYFDMPLLGIAITSPGEGWVQVNDQICSILGYSRDELVRMTWTEMTHPDDLAADLEQFNRILSGQIEKYSMDKRFIRKDGKVVWTRIAIGCVRKADGTVDYAVGLMDDITDRKRAENELSESEEKYRSLASTADSMYLVDSECRYVFMNEGHLSRFGLSWGEVVGRSYSEFHSEEDTRHFAENIERVFETGKSFQTEHKSQRDNKHFLRTFSPVVDSKGSTFAVTIASKDITERKRAEQKLKESEAKYRNLIEQAWDAIFVVDKGGKILLVNEQSCLMLGYTQAELTQLNVADTYSAEERATMAERIAKAQRGEHLRYERSMVRKDGTTFPIEVAIGMLPNGLIQGIVRDITERRQAEDALRKSESNLRALAIELSRAEERERQRLASFLHDEIGQSLSLLRMKFGSLAEAVTLKTAKKDLQKALDVLENVIDQTHTLTFELSPPVLHQLGLAAAIEWAGEKVSQDHEIDFIFSDDGRMKPLDIDLNALLFRCVRELMMNIVKHAKARKMTVSLKRTQNQFTAVVEDNGIGFDTSLLDRQLDKVGFGLFSIRERLAALSGTFELRSEPGRGTRVTLSVPLKEEIPSS